MTPLAQLNDTNYYEEHEPENLGLEGLRIDKPAWKCGRDVKVVREIVVHAVNFSVEKPTGLTEIIEIEGWGLNQAVEQVSERETKNRRIRLGVFPRHYRDSEAETNAFRAAEEDHAPLEIPEGTVIEGHFHFEDSEEDQ